MKEYRVFKMERDHGRKVTFFVAEVFSVDDNNLPNDMGKVRYVIGTENNVNSDSHSVEVLKTKMEEMMSAFDKPILGYNWDNDDVWELE